MKITILLILLRNLRGNVKISQILPKFSVKFFKPRGFKHSSKPQIIWVPIDSGKPEFPGHQRLADKDHFFKNRTETKEPLKCIFQCVCTLKMKKII